MDRHNGAGLISSGGKAPTASSILSSMCLWSRWDMPHCKARSLCGDSLIYLML